MGKHRCVFRSRVRILSRLSERERRQNIASPFFCSLHPVAFAGGGMPLAFHTCGEGGDGRHAFSVFCPHPNRRPPPAGSVLSLEFRGTRRPARSGGGCRSHTILPPYGANRMLRLPAAAFLRFFARPFCKKATALRRSTPFSPISAPPAPGALPSRLKRTPPCVGRPSFPPPAMPPRRSAPVLRPPCPLGAAFPASQLFFKVFRQAFLQKGRRLAPQRPLPSVSLSAALFPRRKDLVFRS